MVVGAWRDHSVIHMKEARIALLGLKVFSRQPGAAHSEVLSLGDNMDDVLVHDRGRARNHALNAVCRRGCPYRLALNVEWRRRYIETSRNPSDWDSRLADRGGLRPGERLRAGVKAGAGPLPVRDPDPRQCVVGVGPGASELIQDLLSNGVRAAHFLDPGRAGRWPCPDRGRLRFLGDLMLRRLLWLLVLVCPPRQRALDPTGRSWISLVTDVLRLARRYRVPVLLVEPPLVTKLWICAYTKRNTICQTYTYLSC